MAYLPRIACGGHTTIIYLFTIGEKIDHELYVGKSSSHIRFVKPKNLFKLVREGAQKEPPLKPILEAENYIVVAFSTSSSLNKSSPEPSSQNF